MCYYLYGDASMKKVEVGRKGYGLNRQNRAKKASESNKKGELKQIYESFKSQNTGAKRVVNVKLVLLVLAVFAVIVFAFIMFFNRKPVKSDGLIHNKNKSFLKSQKVNGVVFKNVDCTYDGKNSLITYKMVNTTKQKIYLNKYDIVVRNKEGVDITRIVVNSDQYLEPKKEVEMANSVVDTDLSDAYSMDLSLKLGEK